MEITAKEKISKLQSILKELNKELTKRDKLSDKSFNMNTANSSIRAMQRVNGDLIESCKHIERLRLMFAREFKDSFLDIETEQRTINTSGFHEYKM